MEIRGSIALVTGANRGIGRAFVEALQMGDSTRIYAAARNVSSLADLAAGDPQRIVPVPLDITDLDQVGDAAERCGDVNLLINNAGILVFTGVIAADNLDAARTEMEVNYFGTLAMCRAFAPILASNGGGVVVNMLTIGSVVNFPMIASYCASKAAAHSMTHAVRAELSAQGTHVVGVYPGPVDTDMSAGVDMPKSTPLEIAEAALDAVTKGLEDVYPGDMAASVRDGMVSDPKKLEKEFAAFLP